MNSNFRLVVRRPHLDYTCVVLSKCRELDECKAFDKWAPAPREEVRAYFEISVRFREEVYNSFGNISSPEVNIWYLVCVCRGKPQSLMKPSAAP